MATVTITTDTVELFSHEMYFVLTLTDASSASYSARLLDIGKLKYTFDVPNDGEDTTAVGVKAGAMKITIEDFFTGSASNLIDVLVSSYDNAPQTWNAKMYFKTKGGSFGEPVFFTFTQKEVEYKQDQAIVSISLNPKDFSGLTEQEFGDLIDSEVSVYSIQQISSPVQWHGVLGKEYISHWLYQTYIENPTYPMTSTPIVISGIFTTTGNPTSGTPWFAGVDVTIDNEPTTFTNREAGYAVGLMASLEGALYGGSLGVPFYVARGDTTNSVTLDTDNIEKLEQEFFHDSKYRSLIMTQKGVDSAGDPGELSETVDSDNEFAEKNMNIVLAEGIHGFFGNITSSTEGDRIATNNTILQHGVVNYPLAFSFQANKKASVTYWGIDGIYPYSVINFDMDAPSVFQGRDFRIKSVEYDFKQDKSNMEIYEI